MTVNIEKLILDADSKGLRDSSDDYEKLGDAGERTEERVTRSSRKIDTSISAMGAKAVKALSGMVAGYVSLQGAAAALNQARSFDAAFAETSTLINGTTAELKLLEEGSKSLADLYGTSAVGQVQAYYQAISAGADGVAGATEILNAANKLAIGGITDVATGVDALTTAVNAYGPSVISAEQASDAMFVGMRAGKTTIGELSGSLGNIVPIASSAGVAFEEVVAGIAALTTQGLSTSVATTQLRQVIAGVIKPTQEAEEAAAALNLQFDAQALASKGLAGFLEEVIEKTGGSSDELAKLFGSVEALGAALAFAGGGGEAFADIMEDMEGKLGATDAAVNVINESLSKRLNDSLSRLSAVGLEIGQVLLEVAVPALEATVDVVQFLSDNADALVPVLLATGAALAFPLALTGAAAILSFGTAVGSAVLSLTLLPASIYAGTAAMTSMTAATTALTAAVAFLASPLGLVVAGVAAASAAVILLKNDTDLAALSAEAQAEALGSLDEALISVNTSTETGSARARQIAADHYAAADAALSAAQAEARLALERFEASQQTINPFDGPGLDELRETRDRLRAANAAVKALRDRMAEFGAVTNDAGEVIDENTGRVVRTTQEVQRLHAQQLQFMAEDRERAAEAQAEADAILSKYQDQAEMQRLINLYGSDSVQVAEERRERERAVVTEQLKGLDVAESIKEEILNAVDATFQSEAATAAWQTRMSGVAAQLSSIANTLNQMGSSAINTAANFAEAQALEAGATVQEAAHARTIEQINLETEARLSATDNILEQFAIRGAAAQQIAEVESEAALAAARAAANERDAAPAGSSSGGATRRQSEALKERNSLMDDGKRITESLWTEQEKYNAAVEQANRLLSVGALSTETYEQHVAKLSEELANAQFQPLIDGLTQVSDGMIDAMLQGDNLLDSFVNLLGQMAAEALKADIGNLISGLFGGSTNPSSGFLGLGASLLGGARANGGPVSAGTPYLINEDTPNSEVFVPSQSGAVLNVSQAQEALANNTQQNITVAPTPVIVYDDPRRIDEHRTSPEGERQRKRANKRMQNA